MYTFNANYYDHDRSTGGIIYVLFYLYLQQTLSLLLNGNTECIKEDRNHKKITKKAIRKHLEAIDNNYDREKTGSL